MTIRRPTRYLARIQTLGYLHIGTGNSLRRDFDYVVKQGKTWVIDNDVLTAEILSEGEASNTWQSVAKGTPSSEFLRDEEFIPDSNFFRYVMKGEPSSKTRGSEIQESIKTPWDKPYIPGSSLKGALRTAFMYTAFSQLGMQYSLRNANDSAKFAAQRIEKTIAGKDPNHDILRALHVSDTLADDSHNLEVCNVSVVTSKGEGIPIVLECVPPNTIFEAEIRLDTALLNGYVDHAHELGWDGDRQVKWLKSIRTCANFMSGRRISSEYKRYANTSGRLRDYYTNLVKAHEGQPKSAMLLQLGWGGGWDSKTLGDHLTSEEAEFEKTLRKFKQMKKGRHEIGDPFPTSRRYVVHHETNKSIMPLGWIQVTMEKI